MLYLVPPKYSMKLPHGLSPVWLSIPAMIFVLVVDLLIAKLPIFRAATIQNPEGSGIYKPIPASNITSPDSLTEIRNQLSNFTNIESSMQMPVIDRQISLPID